MQASMPQYLRNRVRTVVRSRQLIHTSYIFIQLPRGCGNEHSAELIECLGLSNKKCRSRSGRSAVNWNQVCRIHCAALTGCCTGRAPSSPAPEPPRTHLPWYTCILAVQSSPATLLLLNPLEPLYANTGTWTPRFSTARTMPGYAAAAPFWTWWKSIKHYILFCSFQKSLPRACTYDHYKSMELCSVRQ